MCNQHFSVTVSIVIQNTKKKTVIFKLVALSNVELSKY